MAEVRCRVSLTIHLVAPGRSAQSCMKGGQVSVSFLKGWLSGSAGASRETWAERPNVKTDRLRDWWMADCWFHKSAESAETHYEEFGKWVEKRPPSSIPYVAWAPYTKVRVDLAYLKTAPVKEIHDRYRDGKSHFFAVAFCCPRNEYRDLEQYFTAWNQSEDFEPFAQRIGDPKSGWPEKGVQVPTDWYEANVLKTIASRWMGYGGIEVGGYKPET